MTWAGTQPWSYYWTGKQIPTHPVCPCLSSSWYQGKPHPDCQASAGVWSKCLPSEVGYLSPFFYSFSLWVSPTNKTYWLLLAGSSWLHRVDVSIWLWLLEWLNGDKRLGRLVGLFQWKVTFKYLLSSLVFQQKGLYPLHFAAALTRAEGPKITELLLHTVGGSLK